VLRRVTLCFFNTKELEGRPWELGQWLYRHYHPQAAPAPAPAPAGGGGGAPLRVLFASRGSDRNSSSRLLLNERELLQQCGAWAPPGGLAWRRAECSSHRFGQDPVRDMEVARQADVLVFVHGAANVNKYFMRRFTSVLEVRPLGFDEKWSMSYAASEVNFECQQFFFAVDIKLVENSAPGWHELQGAYSDVFSARDRHVRLPWAVLRFHLQQVAQVGGDPLRYKRLFLNGTWWMDDSLARLDWPAFREAGRGWARFREDWQALPAGVDACVPAAR
jgi:hypothetical protein